MSNVLYFASQAEADQYALQKQISSYRARFRDSPLRRTRLDNMERRRTALFAPVYKLPDDVLSEVFKAGALRDGPVDLRFSLIISAVVSRWRRVALETPALWTTLNIILPLSGSKRGYEEFAKRAGALPLQIHLKFAEEIEEDGEREGQMIETCGHLWTRSNAVCIEGALGLGYSLPAHFAAPRIEPAPGIRHLRLSWLHLRTFEPFLKLLGACRHLHNLVIEEVMIEEPLPPTTTVAFPDLHTLTIKGFWGSTEESDTLMGYLDTPRLRNLHLCRIPLADREVRYGNSSVTLLEVRAPVESPGIDNVLALASRFTALKVLILCVAAVHSEKFTSPSTWLPPLSRLEFGSTAGIDRFTRVMVDRIVETHGKECLKSIKAGPFSNISNGTRTHILDLMPDVMLQLS